MENSEKIKLNGDEAYKQIIEEYDEISVVPRSGILSVT